MTITRADQLGAALESAQPGDVIRFAPGIYRFSGRSLAARRAGRADAPITVRAREPGTVVLEFDLLEGFLVDAPHWVFEHLTIVGVCRNDDDCEHAFHVVGDGHHTVIRHNEIREFNAHLKINGHGGRFPDHGQVIGNRLVNSHARRTDNPVTPIDLVAASDWHIEGNLIADFVKDGGDLTSYGAFAKGGGSDNRFVRNIVLCEHRLRGAAGPARRAVVRRRRHQARSGCRDRRCIVEHEQRHDARQPDRLLLGRRHLHQPRRADRDRPQHAGRHRRRERALCREHGAVDRQPDRRPAARARRRRPAHGRQSQHLAGSELPAVERCAGRLCRQPCPGPALERTAAAAQRRRRPGGRTARPVRCPPPGQPRLRRVRGPGALRRRGAALSAPISPSGRRRGPARP
ncbi:MAG: hypothetical protein MZW92_44660 [Comamonadaceae bacterium]|nr:hypothetical protein [Comamonadaceae bacterium]